MHTRFNLMILPLCFWSISIPAQTVSIPVGQQGAEIRGVEVPSRGMSEEGVQGRFGEPLAKATPVGDPPISSWEYGDYIVYFETGRVLHTVLKHRN